MKWRWGLLWRSRNRLDGLSEHLIFKDCLPVLFVTRREAREYADTQYGYIRLRDDLRNEPHGWMMPSVVRVWFSHLLRKQWKGNGGRKP